MSLVYCKQRHVSYAMNNEFGCITSNMPFICIVIERFNIFIYNYLLQLILVLLNYRYYSVE